MPPAAAAAATRHAVRHRRLRVAQATAAAATARTSHTSSPTRARLVQSHTPSPELPLPLPPPPRGPAHEEDHAASSSLLGEFWTDLVNVRIPNQTARDVDDDNDLDRQFLRSWPADPTDPNTVSVAEEADYDDLAELFVAQRGAVVQGETHIGVDAAASDGLPAPSSDPQGLTRIRHDHAEQGRATTVGTTTASTATRRKALTHRPPLQIRTHKPSTTASRHPHHHHHHHHHHRSHLDIIPPALLRDAAAGSELPSPLGIGTSSRAPVREAAAQITPYRPFPLVSVPPSTATATSTSTGSSSARAHCPPAEPQPHHFALASRTDWRLSSPARFKLRSLKRGRPLPLHSAKETCTFSAGRNRLIGIGPPAALVARSSASATSTSGRGGEGWGWKARVPQEGERGEWTDADKYIERFHRLLDLSRVADEKLYLASLSRAGTPLERQGKGLTVPRASGTWLTSAGGEGGGGGGRREGGGTRGKEVKEQQQEADADAVGGGKIAPRKKREGGGGKAVAEFRTEGGYEVTEEEGFKFESGMVLRITESDPLPPSVRLGGGNDSGPQPPRQPDSTGAKWHVQGTLLEVRKDRLVVAFDQVDWWPLDADESYQIDIGLDLSSYALQQDALDKLYFDPARQRARNAVETLAAQEAWVLDNTVAATEGGTTSNGGGAGGSGSKRQIREWTLQGTELREAIVPASRALAPSPPPRLLDDEDENATTTRSAVPEEQDASSAAATVESDLFRDNQLINSWIERYRRDDPLVLPGDPDLGLNASQTKAIAMALGDRLSLIQGPPGTGKSQTIVSLIALLKLHFRVPHPILLAAPTHVSVDHLVSLLVRAGLNPLRCGKANRVSPEVRNWTIEKRQEEHPMWRATEAARVASEDARLKLQEFRDEVRGTKDATSPAVIKKDAELVELFRKTWRAFIVREQKLYSSLLATADVFCATAVGSGASKVLNMVDFPIVLLDEAAMCTEPVSLIPLMKGAQHATLIGDHKQLPAVVTSKEARKERLQTSLFERLLQSGTVNSTLLDTQYRMRPAISSFPNDSFYYGALRDAPTVSERPPPLQSRFLLPRRPGSAAPTSASGSAELDSADPLETPFPVSFVSHTSPESLHRQSLLNRGESDLLITIVGDLLAANPDLLASEIGIISPYYAQMRLVSNSFSSGFASARLGRVLGPDRAASAVDVEVNTVDGFQGREKRVVLLSTVRSNSGGWIGFLNDKRRLNVALTRARDALIVVGNEETLRRAAARSSVAAAAAATLSIVRSSVLPALSEEVDEEEEEEEAHPGVFPATFTADADPDADPRVWAEFLDWCQQHGVVQRWADPVPA